MRWLALVIVVASFALAPSVSSARQWTDQTGKYRVEAELVAVRGKNVVLERADGRIVSLPINRLSNADQEFLQQHLAEQNKPAKPVADQPNADEADVERSPIANSTAALAILKKHCHRCHGQNQSDEGGFDYVLDRDQLVSSGLVTLRNENNSQLFQRIVSKDSPMPPQGESTLSETEVNTIRDWIRSGAPTGKASRSVELISHADLYKAIAVDLRSQTPGDRAYLRYFTLSNLANGGMPEQGLKVYEVALAKLINSLSWNRELAKLHPLKTDQRTFRFDLRDLGWNSENWDEILAGYPHGIAPNIPEAQIAAKVTETHFPVVRADWFLHHASRPPLYHSLAQIPETDDELEEQLRVDVQRNISNGRVVRAGFARSGVSQNNRLIERHDSVFGAYWKSYDFAGNTGRKNLFRNPLGPGNGRSHFLHDGGEIIFQLPNGMLGYMLTDADGNRIDRGPIEIVSDPRQGDKTVVNGVSCMSCHYSGFIKKSDEVRRLVLANRTAYPQINEILAVYQDQGEVERAIDKDTDAYLVALRSDEVGIKNPSQADEPISMTSGRYQREVDLNTAAAELGLSVRQFQRELSRLNDENLLRILGALKVAGGVVKRETFDRSFASLASMLGLGNVSGQTSRIRALLANSSNRRAAQSRISGGWATAFNEGKQLLNDRDWDKAQVILENAVAAAPNLQLKVGIIRSLVQAYEHSETPDDLIDAHLFLVDMGNAEIVVQAAINEMFMSLKTFDDNASSPISRARRFVSSGEFGLSESTNDAVFRKILSRLEQNSSDVKTHMVLQYYATKLIHNTNQRLAALSKLHETAPDLMDHKSRILFATLLINSGDMFKGAAVMSAVVDELPPQDRFLHRIEEADALRKAGDINKARKSLLIAKKEMGFVTVPTAHLNVSKLATQFAAIGDYISASGVLLDALRTESEPNRIRSMQAKLHYYSQLEDNQATFETDSDKPAAEAVADAAENVAPEMPMADDRAADKEAMLDPKIALRAEAEQQERLARGNQSLRFNGMVRAAELWIQLDEKERAQKAIEQAMTGLRGKSGATVHRDYDKLSDLYDQIGMREEALQQVFRALEVNSNEYDVPKLQTKANSFMADLGTDIQSLDEKTQAMLDPKYQYRVAARAVEAMPRTNSVSTASTLINAAEAWSKAGEKDEVKRVGALIQKAMSTLPLTTHKGTLQHNSARLAEVYNSADLSVEAIDCYLDAVSYSSTHAYAERYHNAAKQISKASGVPLPKLSAEAELMLDPRHEKRLRAAATEARAIDMDKRLGARGTSFSYLTWRQAADEWLSAEENERALAAYKHVMLHHQTDEHSSEHDFKRAADFYEKAGEKQLAIQSLQASMAKTRSKFSKERYQKDIDRLKSAN
ncbi:hypothetical protein LOC67_22970 [Stieleria sp. JC731]|uniref:SHD1 domain-containing protein n=1 Tax=Pirellulaceae TaxID=2691357 RepID=UPI001E34D9F8|nr:SHD1 domain-containing protein [Stieleria sp. JC731]MCC9603421.1 hypothetical protein [Stieleria sp. JC731]